MFMLNEGDTIDERYICNLTCIVVSYAHRPENLIFIFIHFVCYIGKRGLTLLDLH